MIGYISYRVGYFAMRTAARYEEALQVNYNKKYGAPEAGDANVHGQSKVDTKQSSAGSGNGQSQTPDKDGNDQYKPTFRERFAAFRSAVWRAAVDTVEMHVTHSTQPSWVDLGDTVNGRNNRHNKSIDRENKGHSATIAASEESNEYLKNLDAIEKTQQPVGNRAPHGTRAGQFSELSVAAASEAPSHKTNNFADSGAAQPDKPKPEVSLDMFTLDERPRVHGRS